MLRHEPERWTLCGHRTPYHSSSQAMFFAALLDPQSKFLLMHKQPSASFSRTLVKDAFVAHAFKDNTNSHRYAVFLWQPLAKPSHRLHPENEIFCGKLRRNSDYTTDIFFAHRSSRYTKCNITYKSFTHRARKYNSRTKNSKTSSSGMQMNLPVRRLFPLIPVTRRFSSSLHINHTSGREIERSTAYTDSRNFTPRRR